MTKCSFSAHSAHMALESSKNVESVAVKIEAENAVGAARTSSAQQSRLFLGLAAACVGVSLLSLLLALALGVWWLAYPGVLMAYVGASWIVPGLLVGMATTEAAKRRGRAHAIALGVGAGIAAGAIALAACASLLAALEAD